MAKLGAAIVVPTIREQNAQAFLDHWTDQLTGIPVYLIEDNPSATFSLIREKRKSCTYPGRISIGTWGRMRGQYLGEPIAFGRMGIGKPTTMGQTW